jgi:hypothetical protein
MPPVVASRKVTLELASATGERRELGLELVAPGTLEVLDGPLSLRQRWTGEDWFGATLELRRRAEQLGWRALIAGARADVWPTLAQRDAGGLCLTRIERWGQQRYAGGVVELFEPAPVEHVVAVGDQVRHWRDWLERPAPRHGSRERKTLETFARLAEHILVDTPRDDPRFAFIGGTLGWWRVDHYNHLEPRFRYNPRPVGVVWRGGKRMAELLLELEHQQAAEGAELLRLEQVRARLWRTAGNAIGRGPDAFVALADLREQLAAQGLRICVQGAVESAWRRTDDGITVRRMTLGYKYGTNKDLLDYAEPDEVVSVEEQRRFRQMYCGWGIAPSDEVLAWARAEPDSWRPHIWERSHRSGPHLAGWWRSDAWGRVVEFRPNPGIWRGMTDSDRVPPKELYSLYPLDGY